MSEPYQDWEDLHEEIKNHAFIEYHLNSMTHSNKFMRTMNNPEKGIGVTISEKDKEKFEENREILTCIIKCFEVYGWLGIGLKDRREDSSISSFNNGNFKELPGFRANSRDNTSRKHLDAGKRNAMYTTKTTQNDFLENIKEFIQEKFTTRSPASRTDNCLEFKSTKLQILQALSSWESFCNMYLRENQEKVI